MGSSAWAASSSYLYTLPRWLVRASCAYLARNSPRPHRYPCIQLFRPRGFFLSLCSVQVWHLSANCSIGALSWALMALSAPFLMVADRCPPLGGGLSALLDDSLQPLRLVLCAVAAPPTCGPPSRAYRPRAQSCRSLRHVLGACPAPRPLMRPVREDPHGSRGLLPFLCSGPDRYRFTSVS